MVGRRWFLPSAVLLAVAVLGVGVVATHGNGKSASVVVNGEGSHGTQGHDAAATSTSGADASQAIGTATTDVPPDGSAATTTSMTVRSPKPASGAATTTSIAATATTPPANPTTTQPRQWVTVMTLAGDGNPAVLRSNNFSMETGVGRILLDEFDGTNSEVYGGPHLQWTMLADGSEQRAYGGCAAEQCKPGYTENFEVPPRHAQYGQYYKVEVGCSGCTWKVRIQEFR